MQKKVGHPYFPPLTIESLSTFEVIRMSSQGLREELTAYLLPIVRNDPTIGYESSNHYFYVPQDLLEKQLNIRYVLDWLDRQAEPRNSETSEQ